MHFLQAEEFGHIQLYSTQAIQIATHFGGESLAATSHVEGIVQKSTGCIWRSGWQESCDGYVLQKPRVGLSFSGSKGAMDADVYLLHSAILRSCTSTVKSLGRAVHWQRALTKLADLKRQEVLPDQVLCSSVITACGNAGEWSWALSLFDTLLRELKEVDVVTCTSVIRAFGQSQCWQQAVLLLRECHGRRVEVNCITYNAVIISFKTDRRQWRRAAQLLLELTERSLKADLVSYNAALSTFEAEAWPQAQRLLHFIQQKGQVDLISYSTTLSMLATAEEWRPALQLFADSLQDVKPDVVALNSMISAFGGSGEWQKAIMLLAQPGLRTNLVTHNTVTSASGRGLAWKHTEQLLCNLSQKALKADLLTFNPVVDAQVTGSWRHVSMLLHFLRVNTLEAGLQRLLILGVLHALSTPGLHGRVRRCC